MLNDFKYVARHKSRSSACTPSTQPLPISCSIVRPRNPSHLFGVWVINDDEVGAAAGDGAGGAHCEILSKLSCRPVAGGSAIAGERDLRKDLAVLRRRDQIPNLPSESLRQIYRVRTFQDLPVRMFSQVPAR